MALRTIREEGDEILAKTSREVTEINERILGILDDMAETMYAADGLGLAAVQVGILRRLVVIDVGKGVMKLINPKIIEREGTVVSREGCLSVPGENGIVLRPKKVIVEYTDVDGNKVTVQAEGLLKKAFCHEFDHLDGKLYTDVAEIVFPVEDSEKYDKLYGLSRIGEPRNGEEVDDEADEYDELVLENDVANLDMESIKKELEDIRNNKN